MNKTRSTSLTRAALRLYFIQWLLCLLCILIINPGKARADNVVNKHKPPAANRSDHPLVNKYAVDTVITGTVANQNGQPVAGASITVQGTNTGTVTDSSGYFRIDVPGSAMLVVSSVGFQPKTVPVANQTSIQIMLVENVTGLNDVVVVGYTTQRKKDLTGAVSVINTKDIKDIPVGGVEQVMQGKAPGVAITAQTGAPGDAIAVRIRGIGTINDNNPLYIIDGVPTKTGINEISPNDIENINILKDASSAAIYGARASNGVVIITTKRGRSGKTRVALNGYTGTQTTGNLIDMANTQQYVAAYNTAAAADGRQPIPEGMLDTLPNVNWLKEVLQNAPINNLQLR